MDVNRPIFMNGWAAVSPNGELYLPPDLTLMCASITTKDYLALVKSFRAVTYLSGEVAKA